MKKSVADATTDLAELSAIQGRGAGPATGIERSLAEVLADIVRHRAGVGRQPLLRRPGRRLDADGPFCARVRKRADLPSVSMPDIYQHPTIRSLAAALAGDAPDR